VTSQSDSTEPGNDLLIHVCPHCKTTHDMAAQITDGPTDPPLSGDISMCAECGMLSIFDDVLALRVMTTEEEDEVLSYPEIIKARFLWEAVRRDDVWQLENEDDTE